MSHRGRVVLFLCLALAGCSSAPSRNEPDFTLVPEPPPPPPAPVTAHVTPAKTAPPPAAPAAVPPIAPAPVTNRFSEGWIPLERWCHMDGFSGPRRVSADAPPVYSVAAGSGTMTLRVGSQTAYWNGLEYLLGFAPQIIDGRPWVNTLDVRNNFEPLLTHAPGMVRSNRLLVIDPGHGGTDTGAQSVFNGHYEKEYTLDLARRLQPLLATNGWRVVLTRTDDSFLPPSSRVAFTEQQHADFFLSLHFNSAAPDHEQAGLETYCLTPHGMPSNLTRGYVDNPALIFPNNNFDALNFQYAVLLHRALLRVNGQLDRGVRRARFLGVLQNQNRPAVLVEGGFLSNPREAREIADPAYRERMAEALAGALLQDSGPGINLASRTPAPTPATVPEGKTN